MFLGSSVLFAIYDAVAAARRERGLTKTFTLNSPATPELIRMTCRGLGKACWAAHESPSLLEMRPLPQETPTKA